MNLAEIARKAEQSEKNLNAARQDVARYAARAEIRSEDLAGWVNALAEAEGYHEAVVRAHHHLSWVEENPEQAEKLGSSWETEIIEGLLRGADDGWSGRTNDVKRARFDGYRKAAQRLLGR